jgi:hypothetical protein
MSTAVHLSGTLQSVAGAGSAGTVVISLVNFGDNPPLVSGTMLAAPVTVSIQAAANGTWSTTLWGNDQLSPKNTFYQVQVIPAGAQVPAWAASYIFNSGTYDLSTQTPVSQTLQPVPPYVLSGIVAQTAPSHNWLKGINPSGTFSYSQPAFSDVSGNLTNAQMPVSGAYQWVNLVADGVTDNYAVLAAALAAVPANGGTIFLVPVGTGYCYVSQSVTISIAGTVLRGSGWSGNGGNQGATVLQFAANQAGIVVSGAESCIIENLSLLSKDSGAVSTDHGLWFKGFSGTPTVRNVGIVGFGGNGFLIDSTSGGNIDQWRFDQIYAKGNYGDGFKIVGGSDGNVGVCSLFTSESNGGWGLNLDSGAGGNMFHNPNVAGNTTGGIRVNNSNNEFLGAYVENDSTPSNFVITSSGNNNYVRFHAFGQPATITNSGGLSNVLWGHDNSTGYQGFANLAIINGSFATSNERTYYLNNGGFNPKDLTIVDDLGVTWFDINQNFAAVLLPKNTYHYQLVGATSLVPQNSPEIRLIGQYWTGSVSGLDEWSLQDIVGSGTNGTSTLKIYHTSGSSGAQTIELGNPVVCDSNLTVSGNTVVSTHTPSSSSDTGTAGQVCWDSSYVYICVSTNTWKRAAITTW